MIKPKLFGLSLAALMFLVCVGVGSPISGQTSQQDSEAESKQAEADLDTQLYLIVGTNQDPGEGKIPAALDPVMKQLQGSLPFKNYHLAGTLINRVKNNGRLNVKWVGGPLLASAAATPTTPTFNEFRTSVKLVPDEQGRMTVRMDGFSFGARIPIQTYTAVASAAAPSGPVINYEQTGLNTDISMREGQPVVVGTLNLGPSGDAIILVISAKRTAR